VKTKEIPGVTTIYPLCPVEEPDYDEFARRHAAQKFPDAAYEGIVRQVAPSQPSRYVLLVVRIRRDA
jgi:hypothetical protein